MARRLLTAAVLLIAACLVLADERTPATFDGNDRELARLREQIRTARTDLDDLAGREASAARSLDQVRYEADLVRALLAGLDAREALLADRRDSLQADLDLGQAALAVRTDALARRLRSIAMGGTQRELELVLASESFSSLVTRVRFATMLARLDAGLVEQARRQSAWIATQQQELQVALTGLWEAREEAAREREQLELLEATQAGLVRQLKGEKRQTADLLAGLEERERKLREVLERIEARSLTQPPPVPGGDLGPSVAGRLTGRRGQLAWPITGRVVQSFGKQVHPEFKTVTLSNGIAIAGAPAAPVHAIAAGTVEFAEHLPGFGLCVILDHGAGQYTLYANLAQAFVTAGREIGQGQVLAELGPGQGGERPQLYFEVRQGRDPQDPLLWLTPEP